MRRCRIMFRVKLILPADYDGEQPPRFALDIDTDDSESEAAVRGRSDPQIAALSGRISQWCQDHHITMNARLVSSMVITDDAVPAA